MAWATPTTRSTGYVVTASNWNEIVNDLRYLKGLDGAVAIENAITLTQITTPSAPGAGLTSVYAKTDGALYVPRLCRCCPRWAMTTRCWSCGHMRRPQR